MVLPWVLSPIFSQAVSRGCGHGKVWVRLQKPLPRWHGTLYGWQLALLRANDPRNKGGSHNAFYDPSLEATPPAMLYSLGHMTSPDSVWEDTIHSTNTRKGIALGHLAS